MNDEQCGLYQQINQLLYIHTFVELCKRLYDYHSGAFRRKEARLLRKQKTIKIASVRYNYVGTDEKFNLFVRNVIKDYLQDDSMTQVFSENSDSSAVKEKSHD